MLITIPETGKDFVPTSPYVGRIALGIYPHPLAAVGHSAIFPPEQGRKILSLSQRPKTGKIPSPGALLGPNSHFIPQNELLLIIHLPSPLSPLPRSCVPGGSLILVFPGGVPPSPWSILQTHSHPSSLFPNGLLPVKPQLARRISAMCIMLRNNLGIGPNSEFAHQAPGPSSSTE